ncbi:MAG: 5'/3'-nucleotidase SurE [Firmicutes bacterium]|uniref:5'/3'-nucleotidase SurE n=1 Tax=Limnochorda pilosa TaxID=1555112 RepID=UPI0017DF1BF2|nr:5'/3'-nucleotidase SurE [Limnochorda pilosa]MBO2485964.1 5'/3'-nucleotidase SurE [Bacillota bacterium]MBO2518871.1 5'/3'-nucleotidase SurE [Bacillota bacterium]NMA71910.1 5'/3'-nucleotidase SurE [Bacillota bacterium]
MRILVTNDDGIHAPGLRALVQELVVLGSVVVVAPDRERSGTGHGITVHTPLRVTPVEWGSGVQAYSLNGTPADCVKLAIEALIEDGCDLVLSGVNRGPNLGTDVLYSGTVSGAVEGYLHGLPALAVSLDSFPSDVEAYRPAARLAAQLARRLVAWPVPLLLNVNVPGRGPAQGVRITRLGTRTYRNVFDRREDPRGRAYYWLAGEAIDLDLEPGTDARAIQDGFVSITPLRFDMTDLATMDQLRPWEGEAWPGVDGQL